ncbi:MAG: endolytic transglycosylase MltG [bacterium]
MKSSKSFPINLNKKVTSRIARIVKVSLLTLLILGGLAFSLPFILATTLRESPGSTISNQFPVTVNPRNKTITENAGVNMYLQTNHSLLQAAAISTENILQKIFEVVAVSISEIPFYQNMAAAGSNSFVTIGVGFRKEQVADAFAKKLGWTSKQKKEFLTPIASSTLPRSEGSFFPGLYAVGAGTTPLQAQIMVNERFSNEVFDHYGTTTEQIVPLDQALIIASLIQRETAGTDGMRLISGILWNRLFANMRLQVDATLQYAESNSKQNKVWWPTVEPADKFIKSPYNTYMNSGLPPTPIANPSVAAILAALNPIKTDCLYYFNDKKGKFHCSATYEEHKKLIAEYY